MAFEGGFIKVMVDVPPSLPNVNDSGVTENEDVCPPWFTVAVTVWIPLLNSITNDLPSVESCCDAVTEKVFSPSEDDVSVIDNQLGKDDMFVVSVSV